MKKRVLAGVSVAAALALAACGGDSGSSDTTAAPSAEGVDLSAACPATISVQTDWHAEAEHGFLYNMVGEGYTVNTEKKSVTGDLVSEGKTTGVKIEVREGGPATSFESPTATMYTDPSILLAFVSTDEQVSNSVEKPTIDIVAPFNINPQIIMWDPATYPDVKTIADLGKTDAKVRYFNGGAYMVYLIESGQLPEANTDGTYDGSPAGFIADAGKSAQQGFGTSEPYFYEKVLTDWMKPVAYQYVHDAGWTAYAQSLGTTPANLEKYRECFKGLVPVIQKAQRDYIASPERANALIIDLTNKYNDGWAYDAGQAAAAVEKMQADKLVANSPDGTLGSFDLDRVNKFIETATPIYTGIGSKVKEGLTAADIVTNEFIDPSIKLG